MIITLKTLLQHTFTLEVDEDLNIKDLKKRINEERGADFPAESLNLIYSGAIMKDEEQIKDYKIDSKKFIVVMKKKEKVEAAAAAAAAPPPVAAAAATSPTEPTSSSSSATAEKKPVEQAAAVTTTTPAASAAAATTTSDNEDVIRNMMELGYSRRLVEAALRLSYNNPDVACEYLISDRITEANMDSVEADNLALGGVRDELMDLADAYDNSRGQGGAGGNPENEPLAFLRSQPQFHQMRSQIQENPQFLNTVLQQIGVNNPGLLKLISENQAAFVSMINEPLNNNNNTNTNRNTSAAAATASSQPAVAPAAERMEEDQPAAPATAAAAQNLDLTANDDLLAATLASQLGEEDDEEEDQQQPQPAAGGQQQQQPHQVQVELPELTDGDRAAIVRIREISGFPEIEVIQAYIACGNNEELALNFLFTD